MMTAPPTSRWLMIAALATVYIIWGSTYLGIAIAVAHIPPLSSAGVRHLLAGAILFLGLRCIGTPWPAARTWIGAFIMGFLMLVLGNGLVCIAELHVPSGLTALLLAITPIFVVAGTWMLHRQRPTRMAVAGMILGLMGVAVLCAPSSLAAPWWAYMMIFAASCAWAAGLVLSPQLPQADGLLLRTAMQMLAGGSMLLIIGALCGERLPGYTAAPSSWAAVLYLAVFGSLIAYTAYLWLQRHATPALATSNSYVNPLVALLLGSTMHGEHLNGRIGLGAALVIGAVAAIAWGNRKP